MSIHLQICETSHGVNIEFSCGDLPSFRVGFLSIDFSTEKIEDLDKGWLNKISEWNISLIVMNSEMHFHSCVRNNVNATLSAIYTRFPEMNILWRNSVSGHVNCEHTFTAPPLTESQNISIYSTPNYKNHYTRSYNWFQLISQNNEIEDLLSSYYPQILHINVYNSTALRADSHKILTKQKQKPDCLHYCIPGNNLPSSCSLFIPILNFHL